MRLNLPGLLQEPLPSGNLRYRVRVQGNKARRITLPCGPDHKLFLQCYHAARAGIVPEAIEDEPQNLAIPKSFAWLSLSYEKWMQGRVEAGLLKSATAHQRAQFLFRIRADHGTKHMAMPRSMVIKLRDELATTPGAADNMVKTLRALYAWAVDYGHLRDNPASGIAKINRGTGAVPWSADDLNAFRKAHPQDTMAGLALSLFMFTACRVSDIYRLGRGNEVIKDGLTWLDWQPAKNGSARVTIPVMPPLAKAIRAQTVVGPTYLLNGWGRPFASSAAFGNWFRDRVKEAKLANRSPHGIRKAAGELMAQHGVSQYHIMAVHGHSQAKTSEVYTRGVNRERLAFEAVQAMNKLGW